MVMNWVYPERKVSVKFGIQAKVIVFSMQCQAFFIPWIQSLKKWCRLESNWRGTLKAICRSTTNWWETEKYTLTLVWLQLLLDLLTLNSGRTSSGCTPKLVITPIGGRLRKQNCLPTISKGQSRFGLPKWIQMAANIFTRQKHLVENSYQARLSTCCVITFLVGAFHIMNIWRNAYINTLKTKLSIIILIWIRLNVVHK